MVASAKMPIVGKEPPLLLLGRYETGKLLGKGSFASVYHARNIETGEEVAIKMMEKDQLAKSGVEQEQVMSEIEIMRRVRHPNVVRIHEVMGTKKRIFIVMEFVRGGSLINYLAHGRGIGENPARRVFQQLVSAVEYCHLRGVFHRDIKPENILVDDKGNVKVADFGLSAIADTKLDTICGTPMYIAPEVFRNGERGYDGALADVWSCGVFLFVIVAGKMPFNSNPPHALYGRIMRGEYQCPESFSLSLARLIRRLLNPHASKRITIPQIKQTVWFRKDFKEINFYIGSDERPRTLGEYDDLDSDSDSDDGSNSTLSSTSSSEDPSSPVEHRGSRMHISASAPSLTDLEKNAPVQGIRRLKSANAFDIIASSPSLDLSGMFNEPGEQMRFVSAAPVPKIISQLEEIAGHVSFTARTRDHQVIMEAPRNGLRGALIISAKVLHLTPDLVMIKVCKKAGDTAEYHQFCDKELKPGLCGLVDGLPTPDSIVPAGDSA